MVFLFSFTIPYLLIASTIVIDDFNRANGSVGNGWTDTNASIVSNTVRIGDNNGLSYIEQETGSLTYPYTVSVKVTGIGSARTTRLCVTCEPGTGGQGDGVNFDPGSNSPNNFIVYGTDLVAQANAQVDMTVFPFWVWVTVSDAGGGTVDIDAYFSTTSTQPGSPTVSLNDVVASTGDETGLFVDANGGGAYTDFDDFLLEDDSSEPPPPDENVFLETIYDDFAELTTIDVNSVSTVLNDNLVLFAGIFYSLFDGLWPYILGFSALVAVFIIARWGRRKTI